VPSIRVGRSRLLGLTRKLESIAPEQNVRRQCFRVSDPEDDLRDFGGIPGLVAPIASQLLHACAD
jgi:hypothetical protein